MAVDDIIAAPVVYGILQPGPDTPDGIPYIRPTEIVSDVIQVNELRRTSPEIAKAYERSRIQADDVILSIVGTIGKVALVPEGITGGNITQSSARIRVDQRAARPSFIAWALRSPQLRKQFDKVRLGTAVPRLNIAHVRDIRLPLPPFEEQSRIVGRVEELVSDLDAGVADLGRAKAKLKLYRAAVLKAAVEGRLTEEWRSRHPATEPASQLLERILAERRRKWEADQIAKFVAAGKEPPRGWQQRYPEPTPPDMVDPPPTPDGWALASVDQLTTTITSGSRDWSRYYGEGTGTFLMAQNVRPGRLDLSFRQPVNPPADDRDRLRSQVNADDLLTTIVGANTGDVCRVPSELPEHYVCQSVALMRPVDRRISRFVETYLAAEYGGQRQFRRYIYGQGRPHLGFEQLRMTAVPIPPLDEQQQIVAEVEQRLSATAAAEEYVAAAVKRATRLRQSILKQAFEGKLVPQDAADEPAAVLLERIRRESHATGNGEAKAKKGPRRAHRRETSPE